MLDQTKIKCLIFDLDDTLVNSETAYEKALKVAGVIKLDFQRARGEVKNLIGDGHVSARNRLLYFKTMLENQGQFSATATLDLMERYESALEFEFQNQWNQLRRDDLMTSLSSKFLLGIVSNENTRTQLIKLRAMDPQGKYFRWAVFSEDVGLEKPHQKIFERFLKLSGLEASSCMVIGDSYANDVLPAESMGLSALQTIEFKNSESKSGKGLLHKLDELLTLV